MGDPTTEATPNTHKRVLRAVAVQTAILSAACHLLWAWPRLGGGDGDPRPVTFVLAAAFTLTIAVAVRRGGEWRRLYALGGGTLAAFLFGFAIWHRGALLDALLTDPLALVAKSAELVGVVAFVALYRIAPPSQVVLERRRANGEGRGDDTSRGDANDAAREDVGKQDESLPGHTEAGR